MRKRLGQLTCGLLLALLAFATPGLAEQPQHRMPIVTGEHWLKSTPQERKSFLLGACTIIALEHEVQGTQPASNSTIDTWAKGLSHFTFTEMMAGIDKWYADHPDKLSRPVVEVMWYELAKPNCDAPNIEKK